MEANQQTLVKSKVIQTETITDDMTKTVTVTKTQHVVPDVASVPRLIGGRWPVRSTRGVPPVRYTPIERPTDDYSDDDDWDPDEDVPTDEEDGDWGDGDSDKDDDGADLDGFVVADDDEDDEDYAEDSEESEEEEDDDMSDEEEEEEEGETE